jgi:pimeloyl-ACP methyl ester carboxylesterase
LHTSVSRHFATLADVQVHYRRTGLGPPVLLLHQSPASSAEFIPLMQQLAPHFAAIALDLPGYGASDPFPAGRYAIESLADHVAAFLDELGIDTAAVYGFHTGASVALSLARRHPRRLTVAICEGLLCLNEAERSEFRSRYIEPFVPRFDGGHLAWLWTRIKDQSLFFPWYERHAAARLDLDAAPLPVLALRAQDWLRSGERYFEGYAAAFAYDPRADLPFLSVPVVAQCHRHDPLAAHLPRLTPLPALVQVRCFETPEERLDLLLGTLKRHSREQAAPAAVVARPMSSRVWQHYVSSHGTALRVLRSGAAAGRAIVIQHGAQSSATAWRACVGAFGAHRPAVAIELPGHGETQPAPGLGLESPELLAELVQGALASIGLTDCDLIGCEAGAAIQVEVARRWPEFVRSLTLIGALDVTVHPELQAALRASYLVPEPDMSGAYLLRAWHEARDHLLFFPWYERRRAFALGASPRLEPKFLQERTVDALLAGAAGVALRRAELAYPLRARLGSLRMPACHAAPVWEPRHEHSRALGGPAREFLTLAEAHEPCGWDLAPIRQALEIP